MDVGDQAAAALACCNHEGQGGSNSSSTTTACVSAMPCPLHLPIHRLGKDLPSWANQICSFNASHIGRHFKGQQGVPVEVTALSLAELMKQSAIEDVQVGWGLGS